MNESSLSLPVGLSIALERPSTAADFDPIPQHGSLRR